LIKGATNLEAAHNCRIAVLTVPYDAQTPLLESLKEELQGKILISVTVPLKPPKVSVAYFPPEGSAAEQAQRTLGPGVRVVGAFQNVGAHNLEDFAAPIECHVLVCSDDRAAREEVVTLAEALGAVGIEAGALANSAVVEGLTSVLIAINKRYKVPGAGIQITGLKSA
jgi:NADPH-dependent F420 reductase